MENIKIEVKEKIADKEGGVFHVTVADGESKSEHSVSLTADTLKRLGSDRGASELVREAFEFFLQKETKESIFKSFDISEIADHFPEFEDVITKRMNNK
ncbi:MAG: hypothetical protein ACQESA_00370 [Patescibacteria group bacterium]